MRRAALALVVLPLALAACGGGKSGPASSTVAPLDAVKQAALKTAKAGSEHATIKATAVAGGQQVTVSGSGDFDTVKHLGSLSMDFSAAGLSGTVDEVLNGTDVYLRSSLFAAVLPAGKTWIKIDLKKAGTAQGFDLSTLLAQDPTQSLKALQALKSVTKVGVEQLPSGSATHYRGRIAAAELPSSPRATVQAGTYDVWIGDDGYVHRVRTAVGVEAAGQKASATVAVDLSDFGKKVTVTVPAAADTVVSNGSIPGLGG